MSKAKKDYYKILGVAETATASEIKKAYLGLAKQYHPDATGGDKAKEKKFIEIGEAYEVLGDEKKRAEYNMQRKFGGGGGRPFVPGADFPGGFSAGGFPGGGRRVSVDLNDLFGQRRGAGPKPNEPQDSFGDIFRDLFSGIGFGGGGGGGAREAERPGGRDVTLQTEVDLAVVVHGGDATVTTPTGRWQVKIPAGVEEGATIRVPGKGEPGQGGRPAGDLLIEVKLKPHPVFRRVGANLEADVPIAIDQAVLGAKVDVPTLEGRATVNVPAGTSSGLKLRLKGKGLPQPGTVAGGAPAARGDLFAVLQIIVPKDVPDKAKELIAEFAKLTRKP